MKPEYVKTRQTIIKELFNDNRKVRYIPPEMFEDIDLSGDVFITENMELIDLEVQLKDFDSEELTNYVELAEELYELLETHISIYVICSKSTKVLVKECEIKSEADFSIKLGCYNEDPAYVILDSIKEKMENGILLSDEDIEALSMVPVMGPKEDRHRLRRECFEIMSKID